jgi:transglutaminase-like putative cysteine protease
MKRKLVYILALLLVFTLPLFGYQEVLREDRSLRSAQELSDLLRTAFESVSSEIYFSVDQSQPWFNAALINEKILEAAWSSISGGLFFDHYSYSTKGRSDTAIIFVSMTIVYTFPRTQIISIVEQTDQKAASMVAALIKPEMDDYEKELVLHDGLVQAANYDSYAFSTGRDGPGTHTPYGVLIEGKGVCDSFSKAFLMLASKAGIECLIVQGTARGNKHSWNLVRIDGSWYHLDVTYDDPVSQKKEVTHDYFNLTDDIIAVNHKWKRDTVPACTSSEENWFEVEKLVVQDFSNLRTILKASFDHRLPNICERIINFNPSTFETELQAAIDTTETRAKSKVAGYSYSYDNDIGTLTLVVKYK